MLALDIGMRHRVLAADLLQSIVQLAAILNLVKLDHLRIDAKLCKRLLGLHAVGAIALREHHHFVVRDE